MDMPALPLPGPQTPASTRFGGASEAVTISSSSPAYRGFDGGDATDPIMIPSSPPAARDEQRDSDDLGSHPDEQQQPKPAQDNEPPLSEEQERLVNLILTGRNVFYTGAAGTGKSRVLREFVKRLKAQGKVVHVVAPTGKAALAVGGSTTWTYAGISPASIKVELSALRGRARKSRNTRKRIRDTDCLVIDEVSMVENHQLERINHIMQAARSVPCEKFTASQSSRNARLPFGGCQLVVTGDFCQLPPVLPFGTCLQCGMDMQHEEYDDGEDVTTMHCCPNRECPADSWPDGEKWAFKSEAWQAADFAHVELLTVHRQAGDPRFINILNNLRKGQPPSPEDSSFLMDPTRSVKTGGAVRLYPTRAEVTKWNQEKFRWLKTEPVPYPCHDHWEWNQAAHPWLAGKGDRNPVDKTLKMLNEHRFEPRVTLKRGMLVVLLQNLDLGAGLVNGSTGIICGFEDKEKSPPPMKQGADEDSERQFTINLMNAQVKEYAARPGIKWWPMVKFFNNTQRPQIIYPECSTHELGYDQMSAVPGKQRPSVACRTQIPLMAAWAMTTHKAQGMTLNRVIVDLSRAFEEGQVYVALSRATSLEGLKIEGNANGLLVGAGGNKEVNEWIRAKFGSAHLDRTMELDEDVKEEPEEVGPSPRRRLLTFSQV